MTTSKYAFIFALVFFFIVCSTHYVEGQNLSFSHERGFYESAVDLILSSDLPNATIKYEIGFNDSYSTPNVDEGIIYSEPIPITESTLVKAIAYNETDTTSIVGHSYLFLEGILASIPGDPEIIENGLLSLPFISLSIPLPDYHWDEEIAKKQSLVDMHYNDPNLKGWYGSCALRVMDDYWDVKRLRIYFSSAFGQKKLKEKVFKDVPFGLPGINSYDIINLREGSDDNIVQPSPSSFYDNHLFLKNRWAHDTQLAMGHESARGNYVNVFLEGQYYGMFHMHEVNHSNWQAKTYGGEKEDYNVIKYDGAINGSSVDWENIKTELLNGNYSYFKQRVDIENFIDYHLIEWYMCNVDWGWNNQLIAGTNDTLDQYRNFVWDVDLSMFSSAVDPSWSGVNMIDQFVENIDGATLLAEDEFKVFLMDRIYKHFYREGVLTPTKSIERLMLRKAEMEPGVYAHQEMHGYAYDWQANIDYTTNIWIPERYNLVTEQFLDDQYYPDTDPPEYSSWGGQVGSGFLLSLTNPNPSGEIYYTLDNTDPRGIDGVISGNAILYSDHIILPTGVIQVRARVFDETKAIDDQWSASCPVRFYNSVSYPDLVINEIMYNPHISCETGDLDLDYIEILNNGNFEADLSGVSFTQGIYYTFPFGSTLSPGEFIVLAEDDGDFFDGYGFSADGQFSGRLDNGGEYLELNDPFLNILDSLHYDDSMPWDRHADGNGTSLELIDPDADNANPLYWLHSQDLCGSPGQSNSGYCPTIPAVVVINEIYYNANNEVFDPGDWIEIYNPGTADIDLTSWEFRDEGHSWTFPSGTTIQANAYLVLVQDEAMFSSLFPHVTNLVGNFGFGLSSNGERISIFNSDDCLVDLVPYNDAPPWPLEPDGNGPSLSLIQTNLDNLYYYNWESSNNINAPNGTPGTANVITDLSLVTTALPTLANGITNMVWTIKIQENAGAHTNGNITVIFPKDPKLAIDYDTNATTIAIFPVENSEWVYDGTNSGFHIWTRINPVLANTSSTFGFEGIYNPLGTSGLVTYTATLLANSGGEENGLNNIDVETLIYQSN